MIKAAFHTATYWAPVLLILLAVIARIAAPFPYAKADRTQAIEASLIAAAQERADSGNVYIRLDGNDPTADILADLNSHELPATFVPWSLRAHSHCPPNIRCGGMVDGDSPLDNVISADLLSMPLWHVALVRIKAGSCSAELTLLRANQWHVISQRTACT